MLLELMRSATGTEPVMWGPSIVGYGTMHYRSPSRASEGRWPRVGFSPRRAKLSLYGLQGHPESEALLAEIGRHTLGAGCVYVLRLEHLDTDVLSRLVCHSFEDVVSAETK